MSDQITKDTLFDGKLTCYQHKNGYRFSLDPILLAHFTPVKKKSRILDLGAGCGIISLIITYRYLALDIQVAALEIQPGLFSLMQQNVTDNVFQNYISPLQGDLEQITSHYQAESFDQVFCNPPFYKEESGRKSHNQEALLARHQVQTNLENIIVAARRVLKNRGGLNIIYPAKNMIELIKLLSKHRLESKKIQFVYSYPGCNKASLVLVEAIKNGGAECQVLPPFFIYECKNGSYTEQMQQFYNP